jgi:hypothetical protein
VYSTVKKSAFVGDDHAIIMILNEESKCHDWTDEDVAQEHEMTIHSASGDVHFQWHETGRLGKCGMHVWMSPANMNRFMEPNTLFRRAKDGEEGTYVWKPSDMCLCLVEIPAGAYVACTKSTSTWKQEYQAMAVSRLKLVCEVDRFDERFVPLHAPDDERMQIRRWTRQLECMVGDIKKARAARVRSEHPLLKAITSGTVDAIRALQEENRDLLDCLKHLRAQHESMACRIMYDPIPMNQDWSTVSKGISLLLDALDTHEQQWEAMWTCVDLFGLSWEAMVCMMRHALDRGIIMTNGPDDRHFKCPVGLLLPIIAAGGGVGFELSYLQVHFWVREWTNNFWAWDRYDVLCHLVHAAVAMEPILPKSYIYIITDPLYCILTRTWCREFQGMGLPPLPPPEPLVAIRKRGSEWWSHRIGSAIRSDEDA